MKDLILSSKENLLQSLEVGDTIKIVDTKGLFHIEKVEGNSIYLIEGGFCTIYEIDWVENKNSIKAMQVNLLAQYPTELLDAELKRRMEMQKRG